MPLPPYLRYLFPQLHHATRYGEAPSTDELQRRIRKITSAEGTSSHWTRAFGYALYTHFTNKGQVAALTFGDWQNDKIAEKYYNHFANDFKNNDVSENEVIPPWIDIHTNLPDSRKWNKTDNNPNVRKKTYLTVEEYFSLQNNLDQMMVLSPRIPSYESQGSTVPTLSPYDKLLSYHFGLSFRSKASSMIRRMMKLESSCSTDTKGHFNQSDFSRCDFLKLSHVICVLLLLGDAVTENLIDEHILWVMSGGSRA